MGYGFMAGCLRASNVLSEGQNCQAILTNLLGEAEAGIVISCINDPNLKSNGAGPYGPNKTQGAMAALLSQINLLEKNPNWTQGQRDQCDQLIAKYNQLIQQSQQKNQQIEQQWDALPQEAETQSNTLATDEQQTISQAQSIISSMSTLTSLLQSM